MTSKIKEGCQITKTRKWRVLKVKCIRTIKSMKRTVWTPFNTKDLKERMMMILSRDTQINNSLIQSIIILMNIEKPNLKIWRSRARKKPLKNLWLKTMSTTLEKINKNQINSIILNKEELQWRLKALKVESIRSSHIVSMKTFLKPIRN